MNLRQNVRKYHEGYEKRDSRTLNEMFGGIPVTAETICDNAVIGAGAVVTKDITEPGTYVGIPARKIK